MHALDGSAAGVIHALEGCIPFEGDGNLSCAVYPQRNSRLFSHSSVQSQSCCGSQSFPGMNVYTSNHCYSRKWIKRANVPTCRWCFLVFREIEGGAKYKIIIKANWGQYGKYKRHVGTLARKGDRELARSRFLTFQGFSGKRLQECWIFCTFAT